jgi:thioredoxin reductase (NADPH)
MRKSHRLVVIGSGPAGLTAALYAARADLKPVVLVGDDLGGQISWTYSVENYPGFPEGISGPDLVEKLRKQAEKYGSTLVYKSARSVDFRRRPFEIVTDDDILEAEAVIVCSGARPRKLGVPGEEEFLGRGVSYCAVCDGPLFKGKKIVVVGGGNSAVDESHFLTTHAEKVILVHRRRQFRAQPVYVNRAKKNPRIEFVLDTVVKEIVGGRNVKAVRLENVVTKKKTELAVEGVFILVGQIPNTDVFKGQVEMDERGFIKINETWQTSVEGVFAAGECEDWRWKQMVTACGDACKASLAAQKFLERQQTDGEG